ncbi:ABC transporter ATP-binding protein [Lagierella sp.]|uniref:ABC transporter ATP-binding protein n=1 Tax=Lagierella sp. TaxID=2849657 RepID=UPI00262EF237|nr:ABC transporter ATP-binding protein [Lagierella sp.]
MINFKNVEKRYNDHRVLKDINFDIGKGEFFVIVGSSGSGKTTTLKMINRLIEPSLGEIVIDKRNIKDYNLRDLRLCVGYVLQQGALFPNLTVYENISLIPEMKNWKKEDIKREINILMEKVGLDPKVYLDRFPKDLSGGEQQRVGILRAIVAKPKILMMDEPFSALDPITRNQLQDLIKSIQEELKITTVFVTHDIEEALKLGDRICVMEEGEIIQIDSPENIKSNPKTDFVEKFFNKGDGDE